MLQNRKQKISQHWFSISETKTNKDKVAHFSYNGVGTNIEEANSNASNAVNNCRYSPWWHLKQLEAHFLAPTGALHVMMRSYRPKSKPTYSHNSCNNQTNNAIWVPRKSFYKSKCKCKFCWLLIVNYVGHHPAISVISTDIASQQDLINTAVNHPILIMMIMMIMKIMMTLISFSA